MRVSILGPTDVRVDDTLVPLRGARLRALLARLALDAGRVVSLDALSLALWDGEGPADVANALQSLVSRLRRALPDPSVLQSRSAGYLLAIPRDAVDAHRFEVLARDGRAALRAGDAATAASLLASALALWRGEPLSDVGDSPYAASVAVALAGSRAAAVEDRLEAEVALGHGLDVLPELTALVDADPLRERAVGLAMQALYAAGRQAEALELYEQTRLLLADRLGTDPSPALRDVHLRLLHAADEAPAAPPARSHPTNLRFTLSSFLGRADELDRVTALLSTQRLVTLVGPGGAGKTRLALETAQRQGGSHTVWVAELAPVTDPGDLAQAVLDAVDVRDVPLEPRRRRLSRDALTQVEDALGAGPTLLVLDNCEHLVDAAARLSAHLLARCGQLRILATSREPLAVTGEVLHAVSMLSLPEPGAGVQEAARSSAVQLLVDRAGAVSPAFALDATTVASIVEVCRRLDGLPLAIELAAARLRTMTIAQLASRLDDRFRLLTGGSRTAVARHRTLRAVVDWSWDLLTAEERLVAERFSVFPGGAGADAARAVCLPGGSTVEDAEDALGALADKSLVQVIPLEGNRGARYRMLETLREFGAEKLAARAELLGVRRAHARYYRDLAEAAEPALRRSDQLEAVAVIDAEHDNILAALRFAADENDRDTAVRIAAALGWYWMIMDSHAEAASWMQVALGTTGPVDATADALVRGLHAVNSAATGRIDLSEATSLQRLLDDVPLVEPPVGHPLLALVEPARALLAEDLAGFRAAFDRQLAHADPWARGALHLFRVQVAENEGDVAAMRHHVALALDAFRATGDRWGLATSLTSLGDLLQVAQDYPGALAVHEEAYRLTTELLPRSRDRAEALMHLALVHSRLGDQVRARALLDRARAGAESSGSRQHLAMVDVALAHLSRYEGDLAASRAELDRAESALRSSAIVMPQLFATVHTAQAHLDLATGELDGVPDRLRAGFQLAASAHDAPVVARVAIAAAAWTAVCGSADRGAELVGVAESLRGSGDAGNPDVVQVEEALRERLGDDRFAAAVAHGAAHDHRAALELIADTLGTSPQLQPFGVAARGAPSAG